VIEEQPKKQFSLTLVKLFKFTTSNEVHIAKPYFPIEVSLGKFI
jgi:hypothetical protein